MEGGGKFMSQTIDKKVVAMDFENDKFEKGVATSLGTIDKLKSSLNFSKVGDAFSGLNASMKGINFGWITDGISVAEAGLLGLAYLGVNALGKIADAAVNAGLAIVKSLTIEPVMLGYDDYGRKLTSIQTITNATGKSVDEVNVYFNQLDEYADKTIYNLDHMTGALAKFTNAGVDLDKSVPAIKGIANMTALAGQDANAAGIAFYNLSQSIAGGFLTTTDYRSLNLANVATNEWKQNLVDAAVAAGTLQKEGEGLYKIPGAKEAIKMQQLFSEELSKGWASTDVLIKVLGDYGDVTTEIGKKAQAAAQDVKSWSMMMETLKASVGTGWTDSFELLIGDLEQAKALYTPLTATIQEILNASTDARNNLIKGWVDLGGRTDLIESFKNAFYGLKELIKPIGEALREIFPPVTAKQLFTLTENLKEFTKGLKLTEEGASTVKRIFKGVFALLDIIVYAFTSVTKAVFGFSSTLGPTVSTIGEFIAKIADFIVGLRDAIRNSDGFVDVIKKITEYVLEGKSAFKKFFESVIDGFKNFKGFKLDGLSTFIDTLKTKFKPLGAIVEVLKKVFDFFKLTLAKFAPIALKLAEVVGKFISTFLDGVLEALGKFEPERVIDLINGGLLSGVLIAIKNFIKKGPGLFENIAEILDTVKSSLQSWQNSLKADTLLKIAAALGIMALSILLLATIDKDKLGGALLAMTTMFIQLGVALSAFEKISASTNPVQMSTMAVGLIGIAAAMLIMSFAVKKLGTMEPKELVNGMLAIVAMIGLFSLSAKVLSNSSGEMITGALALIVFSFAIRSMSEAVLALGKSDGVELAKGLTGVAVLLAELALFMKTTNIGAMGVSSSLGILVLAGAVAILVKSVETLSNIDGDALVKALVAVGLILTEISVFIYATAGGSTLLLTAAGLAVISLAMLGLTEVMERLGALSWDQVGVGLTAMAGALVLIGAASYLLPPNMIVQAAGLVVMAIALGLLADAMTSMSSMTWDQMAVGLLSLAGTLLILAIGLNAMTGAIGGAAALFVAALALMALAPALKMLGSMSWDEIGRGLVALAATLVVLGVAGTVLTPVIPTLLGLGGALLLIGAGMALAGVGLLAFSAGLAALAVSGAAGVGALVVIISSIIGLVPMLVATLGRAILALIDVLVAGAPTLLAGIVTLLTILLDGLISVIPKVVEVVILLVEKLLTALAEKTPLFVQSGYDILIGLLEGVRANLGEVMNLSIDIVNTYLNGIASRLPEIVDSGWNLIIAWVNSMSASVEAHMPELITAVQGLGIAIVKGLTQGIIDGRNNAFDAIRELGQMIIDEFKYILGIHSPSTVFIEMALNMILGLVSGIKSNASQVITSVIDLANKIVDSLKTKYTSMVNAGADLVAGFGNGIRNYIGDAVKAATQLATSVLNAIKNVLGIHSPATELVDVGMFADLGLAGGITKFAKVVLGSIKDLGESAITGFSSVIGRISDVVNSNMDVAPTITPVIDISNIKKGSDDIRRFFDDGGFSPSMSTIKAKSISVGKDISGGSDSGNTNGTNKEITFIQNNNSPKALSPVEIYRNTRNLLSKTQKVVGEND
jgi:phage-related protein